MVGNVARMGQMRNENRNLVVGYEGKTHLEDLSVNVSIILKRRLLK
jgi:hypothetical protein